MAYIDYCDSENNESLEEEEPPPGKEIKGLLVCRFVQSEDDLILVQTPDGELCKIESNLTVELNDVLVGS